MVHLYHRGEDPTADRPPCTTARAYSKYCRPLLIALFSVSLFFKYKLDIPPPSSSVYDVTCCKQLPFHQSNGHFPSWYKQKAYVVRVESDSIIWTHDLLPPLFCRTPIVVFHIVFINARTG